MNELQLVNENTMLKEFIVKQGEAHARQHGFSEEEIVKFGRDYLNSALNADIKNTTNREAK